MDIKEAVEFEREGQKVFRVTGIRDCEEIMQWEILGNSKAEPYFRSYNSSKLSSMRWPFFVYAIGQDEIYFNNVAIPDITLRHKLRHED